MNIRLKILYNKKILSFKKRNLLEKIKGLTCWIKINKILVKIFKEDNLKSKDLKRWD